MSDHTAPATGNKPSLEMRENHSSSGQMSPQIRLAQTSQIQTFDQFKSDHMHPLYTKEGVEAIEVLYRNNVLLARATLFKQCVTRDALSDYGDPSVVKTIRKNLEDYNKAVDEFRAFRLSSTIMFKDNELLMLIGEYMSYLERKRLDISRLVPESNESNIASQQLQQAEQNFYRYYSNEVLPASKAGVGLEMERKATKGLYARLLMALGGGLALIVPMLIMVLHPTLVKSLVVTSVFVIAVAVGLAIFMVDAEPKDIIASVAGYAAVLVVFVGLNTSSAPPGP